MVTRRPTGSLSRPGGPPRLRRPAHPNLDRIPILAIASLWLISNFQPLSCCHIMGRRGLPATRLALNVPPFVVGFVGNHLICLCDPEIELEPA